MVGRTALTRTLLVRIASVLTAACVATTPVTANAGIFDGFSSLSSDTSDTNAPTVVPTRVVKNPTPVAGAPDASARVYHSGTEWNWLETPTAVFPGARIINVTPSRQRSCTVGWIVKKGDENYALVAGHCGEIGDSMGRYSPDGSYHFVGTIVNGEFINGVSDWALVKIAPHARFTPAIPRRGLKLSGHEDTNPTTSTLVPGRTELCLLGASSGLSCGPYLSTDADHMIHMFAYISHGDSGGPVFFLTGQQLTPVGIVSGAYQVGTANITVQPLLPLLDDLGTTIE